MIVKRPFDFKGQIDRGSGWETYNGVVRRGWKVRLTKRQAAEYLRLKLIETDKAHIVHAGASWYEVKMGEKSEKIQGKENAEKLRDQWNAQNS